MGTMGAIPKKIAIYLGLPNASEYTGHCLWRSSASLLLRLHVLKLSQRIKIVKRSRIQPHQMFNEYIIILMSHREEVP
jgi:hypothetical protein